jgi:hypothetical protein
MSQSFIDALSFVPTSQNLAVTLVRAYDHALNQGHGSVTLEHLLLALASDPDASLVLQASHVDLARLNGDLSSFLSGVRELQGAEEPLADKGLLNILNYAVAAAKQSRRRDVNGAIVLAAIVGDGQSTAAAMLRAQGLTFEAAIKALQRSAAAGRGPPPHHQAAAPHPVPSAPQQAFGPEPQRDTPARDGAALEAAPPSYPSAAPNDARPGGPAHAPMPYVNGSAGPSTEEILATVRKRIEASKAQTGARPDGLPQDGPSHQPAAARPEVRGYGPPAYDDFHGAGPPRGDLGPHSVDGGPAVESPRRPEPFAGYPDGAGPNEDNSAAPGESRRHDPVLPGHAEPHADDRQPFYERVSPFDSRGGHGPGPAPPYAPPGAGRPMAPPAHAGGPIGHPPGAARPIGYAPHDDPYAPATDPYAHSAPWAQPGPVPVSRPSYAFDDDITGPPYGSPDEAGHSPAAATRSPAPHAQPRHRPSGAEVSATSPLVEYVPRAMRAGVPETVEVRMAKADLAGAGGRSDGRGGYPHELVVTRILAVRLRAPEGGFWIEPASPETQWIENTLGVLSDDYVSWRWTVTPRYRGRGRLQFVVSVRAVGGDGVAAETALPDLVTEVTVGPNYGVVARTWAGWIAAAIIGGILARYGDSLWTSLTALLLRLVP